MPVFKAAPAEARNGTSLRGIITAKYEDIVGTFGEPDNIGSDDGKVQVEWVLEIEGIVFTIYDYKENVPPEQVTEWHIGGKHGSEWLAKYLVYSCIEDYQTLPD